VKDSNFFPLLDENNRVQTIRESELDFGAVIGKGGFCEVRCASLKQHNSTNTWGSHGGSNNGAAFSTSPKYAMKYLSPSKTTSSRVFQRGVADLAMEACFLSLLKHENIIGLHYVSAGSLEENYNCAAMSQVFHPQQNSHQPQAHLGGGSHIGSSNMDMNTEEIVMDVNGNLQLRPRTTPWPAQPRQPPMFPDPPALSSNHFFGYFLLLDTLHETLTDRIEQTYVPLTMNQGSSSGNNNMWDRIRHKSSTQPTNAGEASPKVQLAQRLEVLKAIASALGYLHNDCRIVFRDIKPDNIGFYRRYRPQCTCGYYQSRGHRDHDGCTCYDEITKLFDFGLAKELKPKYRKTHPAYPDQDTYKLTGCTGSRRYMAPEVCFSDPYNQKADVYSFGMLLYQVASLVTPFDGFSMNKHEREVLRGGYRPDVKISSGSFLKGKGRANSPDPMMTDVGGMGKDDTAQKNYVLASKTKRNWPKELPRLMEECWDYDMRYRPEMKDVIYRVQRCIDDLVEKSTNMHIVPGHWQKAFNSLHHHGHGNKDSNTSPGSQMSYDNMETSP
jgi:serine/threonine protein kinase